MAWTIKFGPRAARALEKELDPQVSRRIIRKLEEAAALDNPRDTAKPLTENFSGLWRWRIAGGYRVIADIQDTTMIILALDAGPRDKIYKYPRR